MSAADTEPQAARRRASVSRRRSSRSSASSPGRTRCSSACSSASLAGGHLLIEGVPGLAKTLTIKTTAEVLGGTFQRVQFTPDLVPSDLVGTRDLPARPRRLRHRARPGLLQLPARRRDQPRARQGAVGAARGDAGAAGHDRPRHASPCPSPFLVMATQNPIESEGTYPLPEAQVDRFMLKVLVDYPERDEELTVVAALARRRRPRCARCCRSTSCASCRRGVRDVYVDPALVELRGRASRRRRATRRPSGSPELAPLRRLRRQPARPDRPRPGGARARARPRPRLRARRRTSARSSRTRSATGSCSRTRRSPRSVDADDVLDAVLAATPQPRLELGRPAAA